MTVHDIKKLIVKSIFSVPALTLRQWQRLFQSNLQGTSVAISTISGWKNGKQEMSFYYRNILIRLLCSACELTVYETEIRNTVLEELQIKSDSELYQILTGKSYEKFLKYVFNELPGEMLERKKRTWKDIPIEQLLEACVDGGGTLQVGSPFNIEMQGEGIILTSCHEGDKGHHKVAAIFLLGDVEMKQIAEKCEKLFLEVSDYNWGYAFVSGAVPKELQGMIWDKYHIMVQKIADIDRKVT